MPTSPSPIATSIPVSTTSSSRSSSSTSSPASHESNVPAIVGGVVGGTVIAVAIALGVVLICRLQKRLSRPTPFDVTDQPITTTSSAGPTSNHFTPEFTNTPAINSAIAPGSSELIGMTSSSLLTDFVISARDPPMLHSGTLAERSFTHRWY